MAMKYTVIDTDNHETVYHGFQRAKPSTDLIAVVYTEGEIDVWAIETTEAIAELQRYYREIIQDHNATVRVYSRATGAAY